MQFSCLEVVIFSSQVWLVVAEFVADTFVCRPRHSPQNSLPPRGTCFSLPPVAAEFREGTPPSPLEDQSWLVCAPVMGEGGHPPAIAG